MARHGRPRRRAKRRSFQIRCPRSAWVLLTVVTAILAVGVYLLFLPTNSKSPDTAADATAPTVSPVALGQKIYAEQCASCHGKNLEGEKNWKRPAANGGLRAPPHDATGHTWHHSDKVLFEITKYGGQRFAPPSFKSNMPKYSDVLSDAEIRAVLAYIKSKWPPRVREIQAGITKRSRQ